MIFENVIIFFPQWLLNPSPYKTTILVCLSIGLVAAAIGVFYKDFYKHYA